jgi:hypothetical protein
VSFVCGKYIVGRTVSATYRFPPAPAVTAVLTTHKNHEVRSLSPAAGAAFTRAALRASTVMFRVEDPNRVSDQ